MLPIYLCKQLSPRRVAESDFNRMGTRYTFTHTISILNILYRVNPDRAFH